MIERHKVPEKRKRSKKTKVNPREEKLRGALELIGKSRKMLERIDPSLRKDPKITAQYELVALVEKYLSLCLEELKYSASDGEADMLLNELGVASEKTLRDIMIARRKFSNFDENAVPLGEFKRAFAQMMNLILSEV